MRPILLLPVLALLAACTTVPSGSAWNRPAIVGYLAAADLTESSGLARSHRSAGLLWSHNDSGGEPVLYALGPDGSDLGRARIEGAVNVDWEDIASFKLNGRAYLLIADTGDNLAVRTDCRLYVIAEPDPAELTPGREITVPIAWEMPVAYADHPRDCESIAVDANEGFVYLLSKRELPVGLYRLPLRSPAPAVTPPAEFLTLVSQIPQPTGPRLLIEGPTGRMGGMPVAMDFASDGSAAVVLTYMDVLVFHRVAGESWASALTRSPQHLETIALPQAEAVCFASDGGIFVTTEKEHAPLIRYQLAK